MKKIVYGVLVAMTAGALFTGCGNSNGGTSASDSGSSTTAAGGNSSGTDAASTEAIVESEVPDALEIGPCDFSTETFFLMGKEYNINVLKVSDMVGDGWSFLEDLTEEIEPGHVGNATLTGSYTMDDVELELDVTYVNLSKESTKIENCNVSDICVFVWSQPDDIAEYWYQSDVFHMKSGLNLMNTIEDYETVYGESLDAYIEKTGDDTNGSEGLFATDTSVYLYVIGGHMGEEDSRDSIDIARSSYADADGNIVDYNVAESLSTEE